VQRADLIVVIGGGVTTDLGGFVAATILRGVRWVAVSTTVLGMADAAVGGKTGIDLPEGKNLAGAFAPPQEVLLWVRVLATLPERELRAGIAEVVKCAGLEGEESVAGLERACGDGGWSGEGVLEGAIAQAVAFKCRVVDEDPREQGIRRVLNFGHTFGHAVESALGPDAIVHGEAVAIGMVMALEFSVWLGAAPSTAPDRMRALLRSIGLPVDPPRLPYATWSAYIGRDKKREADSVRFVVAGAPGTWSIDPIAVEKFAIWLRFAKHAV
jgi:3-dehydroquinate synthetase